MAGPDIDLLSSLYGGFFDPKRISAYDVGSPSPDGELSEKQLASLILPILLHKQYDRGYLTINSIISGLNNLLTDKNERNKAAISNLITILTNQSGDNSVFFGPRFKVDNVKDYLSLAGLCVNDADASKATSAAISNKKISIVLSDSQYVSPSMIDAEPTSIFLNGMPAIVASKLYPYLQVDFEFERPSLGVSSDSIRLRTPSTLKFLLGAQEVKSTSTADWLMVNGNMAVSASTTVEDPLKDENAPGNKSYLDVYHAGMELFTSPQTLIPYANTLAGTAYEANRITDIRDRFRPFMSIVSVTINVVPSVGMMTFKTANLQLKLHDRSRLGEMSDLLKAEIMTRTTLWLTYGMKYPENPNDVYADFINKHLTIREAFGVQNSSYTFDDDGGVTINLELFTKFAGDMYKVSIEDGLGKSSVFKKLSKLKALATQASRAYSSSQGKSGTVNDARPVMLLEKFSNGEFPALDEKSISVLNSTLLGLEKSGKISRDSIDEILQILRDADYKKKGGKKYRELAKEELAEKIKKLKSREQPDPLLALYNEHIVKVIDGPGKQISVDRNPISADSFKVGQDKKYISLGTIFTNLVVPALAKMPMDEIQIFFYSFNRVAGPVSGLNISQFPVDVDLFLNSWAERIATTSTSGASMTLEEFTSLLINTQISDPRAAPYGNRKNYKTDKDGKLEIKDQPKDDNKPTPVDKVDSALLEKFGQFNRPTVQVYLETIDTSTGKSSSIPGAQERVPTIGNSFDGASSKMIVRLHVYDKQSDPFPLANTIMTDKRSSPNNQMLSYNREKIKEIMRSNLGKSVDEIIQLGKENGAISQLALQSYDINKIKDYVATMMPYIKYGTNASMIKNAGLASQSDALLATAQMLRSTNKKNVTDPNDADQGGLPMRIIPSQLSMTTIGCPLLRCAQLFFIDFQTGTSVDNTYIINSVTHNISPGSFTTSVQAVPIDSYARFYSGGDLREQTISMLEDLKKELAEKEKELANAKRRATAGAKNKTGSGKGEEGKQKASSDAPGNPEEERDRIERERQAAFDATDQTTSPANFSSM